MKLDTSEVLADVRRTDNETTRAFFPVCCRSPDASRYSSQNVDLEDLPGLKVAPQAGKMKKKRSDTGHC